MIILRFLLVKLFLLLQLMVLLLVRLLVKVMLLKKGQKHKFTAPCHGVVLVLWSCVPERSYVGSYLKVKCFLTDANDLYKPEFDHLGQQPFFLVMKL